MPPPERPARWILLAAIVKGMYLLLFLSQAGYETKHYGSAVWSRTGGDTPSYIEPIENVLRNGDYYPDHRMPGYGAVYLILRQVSGPEWSMNMIVLIQTALSAVSVYALAAIASMAFGTVKVFYLTYYIYLVSTFVSIWDAFLLTQSLAASSLVLAFYFGFRTVQSLRWIDAGAFGAFLSWAVFLRPVLAPLLPFSVLWLVLRLCVKGVPRPAAVRVGILAVLPFLLCDGAWIWHNWRIHGVLSPLTAVYPPYYSRLDLSLFRFVQAWGGSIIEWDPRAEIVWFERGPGHFAIPGATVQAVTLPDMFTSQFSYNDLVVVKERLQRLRNPSLTTAERLNLEEAAAVDLERFAESIRTERPWLYHIVARARMLGKFLLHSGTYNLLGKAAGELNGIEWLFKVGMSGVYVWALLFGVVGGVAAISMHSVGGMERMALLIVVLYQVLVHPIALRLTYPGYLVPAFPFIVSLAAYASSTLWCSLAGNLDRVRSAVRRARAR